MENLDLTFLLFSSQKILVFCLKESLDNAVKKADLSIGRKTRGIGLGSDGANTNKVLHKLEKEEIGGWLIQTLCLSLKLELVMQDAFKQ